MVLKGQDVIQLGQLQNVDAPVLEKESMMTSLACRLRLSDMNLKQNQSIETFVEAENKSLFLNRHFFNNKKKKQIFFKIELFGFFFCLFVFCHLSKNQTRAFKQFPKH